MKALAKTGLFLSAFLAVSTAWAGETVSGSAKVLDGDTLLVSGKVVGLQGIAAPGLKETCLNAKGRNYDCGRASALALKQHLHQAAVTCELRGTDAAKRALALCHLRGEDLSAWMVEQGHAVADRRGQAPYVKNEMPAWGKRIGLWAGAFDDPTARKRGPYTRPTAVADVLAKDTP